MIEVMIEIEGTTMMDIGKEDLYMIDTQTDMTIRTLEGLMATDTQVTGDSMTTGLVLRRLMMVMAVMDLVLEEDHMIGKCLHRNLLL